MLGVVAHDAGGAEFIASFLIEKRQPYTCCLAGPARNVFSRRLGAVSESPLPHVVECCDALLCGTSSISDLEWQAVQLAGLQGKKVVSVLDHWVNYRARFLRAGSYAFPREIWVGDSVALEIAKRDLPEVRSFVIQDCFFRVVRDEIASLQQQQTVPDVTQVLYVGEPLGSAERLGFNEATALRFFFKHVDSVAGPTDRIVIRPHPKETLETYGWIMAEVDRPVIISSEQPLLRQIVESKAVFGCTSMALVFAVFAGKPAISCIPANGRLEPLPFPAISQLASLTHCDRR